MGSGPPSDGWWRKLVEQQVSAPREKSETMSARVSFRVANLDNTVRPAAAYRGYLAHFRWCYEVVLAKDPARRGLSDAKPIAGHLVARIAHAENGRVCSVQVVDTNMLEEVTDCVESKLFQMRSLLGGAGQLEVVFTFNPP
jgi:hypothetical protein